MEYTNSTKANSFYTIVCGLLRFNDKQIDVQGIWNNYCIWRERMETKIQRINEHIQEKRQKAFNKVLITMTLLNIVGVIFTLSEWFVNLGLPRYWVYPFISSAISVIIVSLIYYIIFRRKS